MTLVSSGVISAGGSTQYRSINLELGRPENKLCSLDGANERACAGVYSGQISFSDFYGKAAMLFGTTLILYGAYPYNYRPVVCSSDGSIGYAGIINGYIAKATEADGVVQLTSSGARAWYNLACSGDGSSVIAVDNGGYVYLSTNSGSTWTAQTSPGTRSWYGCSMSNDGSKMVLCAAGPTYLWYTTNGGSTWTQNTSAGSRQWRASACSDDGTKIIACVNPGYIYRSTDSGVNWTEIGPGSYYWRDVCSSSDGTVLYACEYNSLMSGDYYVWRSTDSGSTWTNVLGSGDWYFICCSSDGSKVWVSEGSDNSYIYGSTDYGVNWGNFGPAGTGYFNRGVACADNGVIGFLAVGGTSGILYRFPEI